VNYKHWKFKNLKFELSQFWLTPMRKLLKRKRGKKIRCTNRSISLEHELHPKLTKQLPKHYTTEVNTVPTPHTFYLSSWLRNTQLLIWKQNLTPRWNGEGGQTDAEAEADGCLHSTAAQTTSAGLAKPTRLRIGFFACVNLHETQGSEETDSDF